MCVYIYIYVYAYVYIYIYIYIYTCTYLCIYTHTHTSCIRMENLEGKTKDGAESRDLCSTFFVSKVIEKKQRLLKETNTCTRDMYGVASVSRIDKIIGLFCKKALLKRRYSAKKTYNLIEPPNRSHPIAENGRSHVTHVNICIYIGLCIGKKRPLKDQCIWVGYDQQAP